MILSHPPGKRILAIDGGGFRGIGCLIILEHIMMEVQSRSRLSPAPCEVFDLICGTSAGGLVAVLLGRFGLDCRTAIEVYKGLASKLFGDDEQKFWDTLMGNPTFDTKAYDDALANLATRYGGHADIQIVLTQDEVDAMPHKTTKTFVTIASDTPDYSNRTYHVRSYPKPPRGIAPPPSGHKWLVHQALRATTASFIFTSPLLINSDLAQYGFRDSSFYGHNNPIDLARNEAENMWPTENVGVVVSLGTGFSSLTPTKLVRGWDLTSKYAKPYVSEVLAKTSPSILAEETTRKRAMTIVDGIISMAVDTQLMHVATASKIPENRVYYRLDPPLGLGSMDLVDCFHVDKIEETVAAWLRAPEGKQVVRDIAAKLVDLNTAPLKVEEAPYVAPPAPPPSTNVGYNPKLDEPRPQTMIEYLKDYHVVFVIDDSGSMSDNGKWDETRDALAGIAEEAIKYDSDGVDMRFFNSSRICLAVKGASSIIATFNEVQPRGLTPTGAALKALLDIEIAKLDASIDKPEYKAIKPLDIIVITDGMPSDKPRDVLVEACDRLQVSRHHPNCIGLQFVQIDDDPDATAALKALIGNDVGNMVDTVPYNGVLTPERLTRILLGGVHPNIRAMLPV